MKQSIYCPPSHILPFNSISQLDQIRTHTKWNHKNQKEKQNKTKLTAGGMRFVFVEPSHTCGRESKWQSSTSILVNTI